MAGSNSPSRNPKGAGRWPVDHMRVYSLSTTASCSPAGAQFYRPPEKVRKATNTKARRSQKTEILAHKRKLTADSHVAAIAGRTSKGMNVNDRQTLLKTPAVSVKQVRRAVLAASPGGTDYIVTPGRHKISVTEFLMGVDKQQAQEGCPAMRAMANYSEPMLRLWLDREKAIDPEVYMLSFKEGTPMEQFRQMAIQSIFQYAIDYKLHEKTVHLTCLNVGRLIYAKFVNTKHTALTHEYFASMVIASLRHAVKNDESFEKSEMFRIDPDHVWRTSRYLSQVCQDRSVATLNKLESDCLKMLENPANPPLAPEFLDRYLGIGGWPEYVSQYRELGAYLIGLALFANTHGSPLRGTCNSKLAAAALVLAVKVINTDNNNTKYEFWPVRLEKYTGLTLEDLKPAIRGLGSLLRNKPRFSAILEKYYGKWSQYDWN